MKAGGVRRVFFCLDAVDNSWKRCEMAGLESKTLVLGRLSHTQRSPR